MNILRITHISILLLAAGVSASVPLAAVAQSSNTPAVLGSGRFVFGQVNENTADQYMLDTVTGRLWRLIDTADGAGSILEAVPYALPDGRSQPLPPDADALVPATPPEDVEAITPLLLPPPRG